MNFLSALSKNGVAVIGAGNMGSGIAQKIAQEGFTVYLADQNEKQATAGKEKIRVLLEEGLQKKLFDRRFVEETLTRVFPVSDFSALKNVALMIEAVFEEKEIKDALFAKLHNICNPQTIFATNTSSLSVTEIGRASGRKDRFGGLHFFFHPAKNKLLEVIAGEDTSRETAEALWVFGKALKKISIPTLDRPGFAVNRFFVPWLNEAVRMLEEEVADIPTIEAAAKKTFGCPMGPFELMNVTGIVIANHAASSLAAGLGEFYAPAKLLAELAEKKTPWSLEGAVDEGKFKEVANRLLGLTFYVASVLTSEHIATREDTDRGATVGLLWRAGPFQMMNRLGTKAAGDIVTAFIKRYPALKLPDNLQAVAPANTSWPLSYVDLEVKHGIATITFNRPEAMNALNPAITAELSMRVEDVISNGEVNALLFQGVGKAFVAGADIRFFVDALKEKDFRRIYEFTKAGQELFRRFSASGKLTVAYVNGMTLGGGVELALACNKIITGPLATFALPETGIGIYPGLGGTQRLPRKIGIGPARYLVLSGVQISAEDALSVGLSDKAIPSQNESEELTRALAELEEQKTGTPSLPFWARSAVLLFTDEGTKALLAGRMPHIAQDQLQAAGLRGDEFHAFAAKIQKTLSYKAPLALRLAENLIRDGNKLTLEQGLNLELQHLEEIFSSEDAMEGLSSVGRKRPEFKGR